MRTKFNNDTVELYYEIFEDGFEIYQGNCKFPMFSQHEPWIPDPSKSYEENALAMCNEIASQKSNPEPTLDERVTAIEANIDYLMLLSDPDSAAEETA